MRRIEVLAALACALLGIVPVEGSFAQDRTTASNPLLESGPDPYIVRDGDTYYYMHTLGDRLEIWKTKDLADLASAAHRTVWRPSAGTPNGRSIWAPELHRIGGKWYIYYTAADSDHDDDQHRGIFVLENESEDPLAGTWIDLGRINTRHPGIDGTIFAYRNKYYFAYSPYVGADSDLAIAEMSSPSTLTGDETIIARPDRNWERQGGRQILEGPAFLAAPNGDLYLAYSGSACWSDGYAVGLLHAPAGSDPLDASVWEKEPGPVLATSAQGHVFAPGHNAFFSTPSGETWIVYHANPRAEMGCTAKRAPHIQPIRWDGNGEPVFPAPRAGPLSVP